MIGLSDRSHPLTTAIVPAPGCHRYPAKIGSPRQRDSTWWPQTWETLKNLGPTGRIRAPGNLGYDLHYAYQVVRDDDVRTIYLALDRPITVVEAITQPRTIDYPFTFIHLRMNGDGRGTGTLSYAARVIVTMTRQYPTIPRRSRDVIATSLGEQAAGHAHLGASAVRSASQLADNASADGIEHDLGSAVQVELFHDVGSMRLDGACADVQQRRDLFVRLCLGDELKDFTFAF